MLSGLVWLFIWHFICFVQQLNELDRDAILSTIDSIHEYDMDNFLCQWDNSFCSFVEQNIEHNATFALHRDMMEHCHLQNV